MNHERLVAGIFAGVGSLTALTLGTLQHDASLQTAGLIILSSMMAFFVGEKNGAKNKTQTT